MKTWKISTLVLMILTVFTSVLSAQEDDNLLEYGQSATGEITNRDFEIEYSFTASQNDIVVIRLVPDDVMGGLDNPSLILLDSDFNVLESVDAIFSAVSLIFSIESEGEYFVLATRRDGRSGDSIGAYTLTLELVPVLEPGEIVEGNITDTVPSFFAVTASGNSDLAFHKTDGDLPPEITVNTIGSRYTSASNLTEVITISGEEFSRALIGIDAPSGLEKLYIISVARPLLSFSINERSANFTLELRATAN